MTIQRLELIRVNEAAKRLKISVCTLRRMTKAGEVPAYKFRNRIVYRQDELDALIEGLEVYQPCGS